MSESGQTSNQSEKNKIFFESMDADLASFFDIDEISNDEHKYAYPIQTALCSLEMEYTNFTLVAEGGMKKIFSVHEQSTNRQIALAQYNGEITTENTEQFLREAQLTASLQHPNIISIYSIGFDDSSQPFFTMELLQGKTLSEHIHLSIDCSKDSNHKPSTQYHDLNSRLDIFIKVCDAVSYAHSKNVLHLDIKPENIHIGNFGEVILCDWGVAKVLTDDSEPDVDSMPDPNLLNAVTLNGQLKGTPGFMAPEQISKRSSKSQQTDIYSLGALLYTMLTGNLHVQGTNLTTLLENTTSGTLMPFSDHIRISAGLKSVIKKALSLQPADRYQSVNALKEDLHKYISGYATDAEHAGAITRITLWAFRHKRAVIIFSLCSLFAISVMLMAFIGVNNERTLALKQKAKAEKNLELYKQVQTEKRSMKNDMEILYEEILRDQSVQGIAKRIELLAKRIPIESREKIKKSLLRQKGTLHFIQQEYQEALTCFEQVKGRAVGEDLINATKRGIKLKKPGTWLTDLEIANVIRTLKNSEKKLNNAVYEKHMRRRKANLSSQEEYLYLARIMLNACNNLWGTEGEKKHKPFSFKDGVLDLSNRPYRDLRISGGYGINVLAPLKLKGLNLSNTLFFEFHQLRSLKMEMLDISGCNINDINEARCLLLKRCGINSITISDTIPHDQIQLLRDYFKVRIVKND